MNEQDARAWVSDHVSRETFARLESYAELVVQWQKAINLVAPSTLDQIFSRHIADSLQVFALADRSEGRWLDIGSGAGFPGLVAAIAAAETSPGLHVTLMESDQRKSTFLRETARKTEVNVTVLAQRIETAAPQNADIISARALAPLTKLCEFGGRHLSPTGIMLLPKGKNHISEQKEMAQNWQVKHEIFPSKTNPEAVIYKIGELSRV